MQKLNISYNATTYIKNQSKAMYKVYISYYAKFIKNNEIKTM